MNYLQDRGLNRYRREALGWKKPAIISVLVIAVYFWGSSLAGVLSFISYPYLRLSGQVRENFSDALTSRKELLAENKKLSAENDQLKSLSQAEKELRSENEHLRGLSSGQAVAYRPILAKVLVRPNHLPYDELVIDMGTNAAPWLKAGELVFADEKVLLGHVDAIDRRSAKIKLYSTGGMKIPVTVGQNAAPSIAEGLGAGNFSLTLPRGIAIDIGDQVRTSIVGNYVLGYVANIMKDPNDPFQKVIFRYPYNIFELEWVHLLND